MKTAAIYVRTSTAQQNTEIQIHETQEHCLKRGWKVIGIFEDKLTGRNINRPQFKKALELARLRKIDVLVVYKLDRAFRSLSDCVTTVSELHELGVEFLSLRDPGVDFTTASGRLLFHLIASFAAFEVDLIKARTKAGIENAKRKGVRLGRPPVQNAVQVMELLNQGLSLRKVSEQTGISKSAVHKIYQKIRSSNPK